MENNENKSSSTQAEGGYIKMDWSLVTPEERVQKTKEIIENTPSEKLTAKYLEKMADYIVFAMDKQERIRERRIITENRTFTLNKREISYEGLVSKLENGEDGLYNMIINDKNILLDPKKDITEEDVKTIPGLKELRDSIADVEAAAKKATGRKKYLLNKQIIEMRKDQYVIKNIFKQPMYSRNLIKTLTRTNLDEKITINAAGDVESTGIINIYNPAHVVILLCNYAGLKMETYDDFNSDIKWMLIDFENIIDKALKEKYPLYYKLLIYKIDGKTNLEIQSLLEEEFGIKYSIEYISSLWRNKIPKLISQQAECDWLEWHYTEEEYGKWKRCSKCKKIKLADNRFFTKNNTSKDGLYSICKECRNSKTKIKSKGEIS
jgi:predicted Zn-ribbon and HTH transcriptional regulator